MKAFKEVEKDRKLYHKSLDINSVHRSSLLVPKISRNKTYISFLNHFFIKRNYTNVALKITGYNHDGSSGDSISFKLEEPRVYSFYLEEILGDTFNCYQAEFFCSNNLFIPFPAVCINHIGVGNVNTVHSFNRILNDVREMDKISSIKVKEASIDLALNKKINTFIIFQSGIKNISNETINISFKHFQNEYEEISEQIPISLPKMSSLKIDLNKILSKHIKKDLDSGEYVLRIEQPDQLMFYGRLFVGIEDLETGSFSGNHSYYDNSDFNEYFKEPKSYRTFPFFQGYKNELRIYPIMSPGVGTFSIFANLKTDEGLKIVLLNKYNFINNETTLSINLNQILKGLKIDESVVDTFTISYQAKNTGSPTRVNMQLIYGDASKSSINSSVNVSLHNDDIFLPNKSYYETWGQILNIENYDSKIGICFGNFNKENSLEELIPLNVEIYDETGIIRKNKISIKNHQKYIIDSKDINSTSKFLWVIVKSPKPYINIYTLSSNVKTGFSSGEHGF